MEWGENRSGKQLALGSFSGVLKKIRGVVRSRISRFQTRRTLSRLTDNQLRDIGLTRDDLRHYR